MGIHTWSKKKNNYRDLKYYAYNCNTETHLNEFQDSITFLKNIGECKVMFEQERNKKEAFNGYLRGIKMLINMKNKKQNKKKTLGNTDMLY